MEKIQKLTGDSSPESTVSIEKQRADTLLLARGLARSRQRARDMIADGVVLVDGVPIVKPSKLLAANCYVELTSISDP